MSRFADARFARLVETRDSTRDKYAQGGKESLLVAIIGEFCTFECETIQRNQVAKMFLNHLTPWALGVRSNSDFMVLDVMLLIFRKILTISFITRLFRLALMLQL
ncbi:hypothetical protein QLX08_008854 [Tetragonisca angustula]|uniref:Uncharacterized protein n=1 Tax=Tetragonisca angustula TaxID=166442 RepID=A0AAW0ZJ33_9HYME